MASGFFLSSFSVFLLDLLFCILKTEVVLVSDFFSFNSQLYSTIIFEVIFLYFAEYVPKFPRMNIRDPYKCLGVGHDASEEEIREARNFLLEQYAGHESSVETIEAAYERILFTSFKERKKTKFNLKSRLRKKVVESPPWMKRLLEFVELPPTDVILRRLFFFVFVGAWSVINSAESGPAFQVNFQFLCHILCITMPVLRVFLLQCKADNLYLMKHFLIILFVCLKVPLKAVINHNFLIQLTNFDEQ